MDVSTVSVDLTPVAPVAPVLAAAPAAPLARADLDAERERLYQQLDDKVCNIVFILKKCSLINTFVFHSG